jgi:phage shock protein E
MNPVWLGAVVVVAVVAWSVWARKASGSEAAMAQEKIRLGAAVIDVRTPGEFKGGHYEGARNIPLQDLPDRLTEVGDKKKAVVVYCASGMRSAQAARILTGAGFSDVTNAGGLRNLQR